MPRRKPSKIRIGRAELFQNSSFVGYFDTVNAAMAWAEWLITLPSLPADTHFDVIVDGKPVAARSNSILADIRL